MTEKRTTEAILLDIRDRAGALTPQAVLDAARDKDHPLHDRFEWDDSLAAEQYRLVQASDLIRHVKVKRVVSEDSPPIVVRAFVSQRDLGPAPRSEEDDGTPLSGEYLPVMEVVANDVTRQAWFRSLTAEWQRLKRKAGASKEFAQYVLDDLRGEVG